jgi:hypothetical protein
MRRTETADPIPELRLVALRNSREHDGRVLPEGATGAVVFAYHDGVGYEVEFDEPFHCVVTLTRDEIQPV